MSPAFVVVSGRWLLGTCCQVCLDWIGRHCAAGRLAGVFTLVGLALEQLALPLSERLGSADSLGSLGSRLVVRRRGTGPGDQAVGDRIRDHPGQQRDTAD